MLALGVVGWEICRGDAMSAHKDGNGNVMDMIIGKTIRYKG